ncbi:TPA_asm: N [Artemisia alphacytorhabdovirus 3]|nr:TPA_asm: N [Artemisia alphacytorhabdovirus 3]
MSNIDRKKIRDALAALKRSKPSPSGPAPVLKNPNPTIHNQPGIINNILKTSGGYTNNTKYQDLNDVTISVARSAATWNDDHFKQIKIFDLEHLSEDDSVLFGQSVFRSIATDEITSDTIFMMLYLAISCRSTMSVDHYLMDKPPGMTTLLEHNKPIVEAPNDNTIDEADSTIDEIFGMFAAQKPADKNEQRDGKKKKKGASYVEATVAAARASTSAGTKSETDKRYMAAAYSYMAAYLMRLQCRNPDEKTLEAAEKAKTRYAGFYDSGKAIVETLDLTTDAMKSIRDVLARKPEVTSTWVAWVAYNENEKNMVKQDIGLLEYLATQVFSYQGMHVVTQTLAIHQITAVPIGMLLREMDCQMTRSAVVEIYNIVKNYHKNEKHPDRSTYYRYSRVWNEGYFSKVQSKSCAQLLYLAAKIVKEIGNNNNSDPTKIHAIKDLSESAKERLNRVADNIIEFIWSQADEDDQAGNAWKNAV